MKKIKDFLNERKDLFLFIGVLLVVVATILTVANLVDKSDGDFVLVPGPNEPVVNPDVDPVIEQEKMILPINEDYIVVKDYFDLNNPDTLHNAVFNLGNSMVESTGMSYAASNNNVFDVLAAYSGKVLSVTENNLEGYEVVILHEDNLKTYYLSLSEVNVKENDEVKIGDVIGKAGTSILDTLAGIHVHFEIEKDGKFINPTYAYNKMISELETEDK